MQPVCDGFSPAAQVVPGVGVGVAVGVGVGEVEALGEAEVLGVGVGEVEAEVALLYKVPCEASGLER